MGEDGKSETKLQTVRSSETVELMDVSVSQAIKFIDTALREDLLVISKHARKEMVKDDINETQIRGVLKQKSIVEGPYRELNGGWKCRLEGYHSGQGIGVPVGFDCREDGTIVVVVTAFTLNNYR